MLYRLITISFRFCGDDVASGGIKVCPRSISEERYIVDIVRDGSIAELVRPVLHRLILPDGSLSGFAIAGHLLVEHEVGFSLGAVVVACCVVSEYTEAVLADVGIREVSALATTTGQTTLCVDVELDGTVVSSILLNVALQYIRLRAGGEHGRSCCKKK